jgi:DNA polymerase
MQLWQQIWTIDIETFSPEDLKKAGIYKYAASPGFAILLFTVKVFNCLTLQSKIWCFDLASGDELPGWVLDGITDETILKRAHNAQFERVCIGSHMEITLDPVQWQCTMIKCAALGLPRGLDNAAVALQLPMEKDKRGRKWITLFCKPCKPTRKNGGRTRNLPEHFPEDWAGFKAYNINDVVVEDAIDEVLAFFEIPEKEQLLWQLDQRINDRGVRIHVPLVTSAVEMHTVYKNDLMEEARQLTWLTNPNSLTQLKSWLSAELDEEITKLDKDVLTSLLKSVDDKTVLRVLRIRQETNKSSISKYTAILRALLPDGYVRGLMQFYGANTGRWSSKLVQLQNLLRNTLKGLDLDLSRNLICTRNIQAIEDLYESLSFVLSQLIRTAIIPREGNVLVTSDFRQIESRVLAWAAEETWKLEAFAAGRDIYTEVGAKMFRMNPEDITEEWRQKSKIGELSCGFQGAQAAILRMWPKHLPMPSLQERQEIVNNWRNANRKIKQFWWDVQEAAITAVDTGEPQTVGPVKYYTRKGFLFCELPSGRSIVYCRPRIVDGMYGDALECYTIGKNFQWQAEQLYGGLLTENLVQGIARDILGEKMLVIDKKGYDICFHVHDENAVDTPRGNASWVAAEINRIMSMPIEWAKGLPLDTETHIFDYYKK